MKRKSLIIKQNTIKLSFFRDEHSRVESFHASFLKDGGGGRGSEENGT